MVSIACRGATPRNAHAATQERAKLIASGSGGTGLQLSPATRLGYFFRIDYEGKDFPVGVNDVTRVYGVVAPGSRAKRRC